MKYEIAYLSNSGNTAVLARAIASMLPADDTHLTDLSLDDVSESADVYFIGFGVNRGMVPMKIMDSLEYADGKTVILFATCGMEPTDAYKSSIERKILPFIPDDCDYKGLFLCAGQFSETVANSIKETLRRQPENAQARALLESYQKTYGHPNSEDLEDLQDFVWEALSY